jgi:hypothetical protein
VFKRGPGSLAVVLEDGYQLDAVVGGGVKVAFAVRADDLAKLFGG